MVTTVTLKGSWKILTHAALPFCKAIVVETSRKSLVFLRSPRRFGYPILSGSHKSLSTTRTGHFARERNKQIILSKLHIFGLPHRGYFCSSSCFHWGWSDVWIGKSVGHCYVPWDTPASSPWRDLSGRFREKPAPSRHPHCTLKPADFFIACIFVLDSECQMTSFRILCLMYLSKFFLHAKLYALYAGTFHRCSLRRYKCMADTKQNSIAQYNPKSKYTLGTCNTIHVL